MRSLFVTVVAVVTVGVAAAADLKSGPQVGSTIPGPFEPLNLNGPDAGDECCLFCKYGNAPVVMVFATKPSDALTKLVRELEAAADAANKTGEVGSCLIVTDTGAATKKAFGQVAGDAKLKHVIIGVIDPAKVKDYELSGEAEVTVLLYSKRVVRHNHAFKPGDLTDKTIAAVMADVTTHYAK